MVNINITFGLCLLICILYTSVITQCSDEKQCNMKNKCSSLTLKDGGNVITMSDESYNAARLYPQDMAAASTIEERDRVLSPTIIAIPLSESEIVEIIKFANECSYTISIRSGGHQYSGLSSCNHENGQCIQIDMKHFNHININNVSSDGDKLITVGSGVHLVTLYKTMHAMDVAVLGGICPTVCAGGHYQSSSQSVWGRSLGLGMDYITRVKIATADGEIRNVYKGDDLFWAVLGGSPGSWGVVIEYEFEPIKNSDYPHARFYSYPHAYTKEGFSAFLNAFIDLLDNPYYANYNDISIGFAGEPYLRDPSTSLSTVGTNMNIFLSWTGIDNGDIHSVIPDHPLNKTWHQELIQPFADINTAFEETQIKLLGTEGPTTISSFLLYNSEGRVGAIDSVVDEEGAREGFRTLNVQHQFNKTTLNELLHGPNRKEYIQSIVDKFDELAGDATDNVEIVWQFWDLFKNEGDNLSHDPLQNAVSYPLRAMGLQSDCVIVFGHGDNYTPEVLAKAQRYQQELKDVFRNNIIKSDLKCYAFTDLLPNEYDLNKQFNEFYDYREDVYLKLKDIKTRFDGNNIFKGALTIPPNEANNDSYDCDN